MQKPEPCTGSKVQGPKADRGGIPESEVQGPRTGSGDTSGSEAQGPKTGSGGNGIGSAPEIGTAKGQAPGGDGIDTANDQLFWTTTRQSRPEKAPGLRGKMDSGSLASGGLRRGHASPTCARFFLPPGALVQVMYHGTTAICRYWLIDRQWA